MKLFYLLFATLISLLVIVLFAGITPEVANSTGVPHPEFKGMLIGPNNIDQAVHTRWLGYFYGLGIIFLFGVFLLIGNRKKGKLTSIGKWILIGIGAYLLFYTMMVLSHWSYSDNDGGDFILMMPAPTAWMIYGVWFVPLIITAAFVFKFEEAIISDEEIASFEAYVKELKEKES